MATGQTFLEPRVRSVRAIRTEPSEMIKATACVRRGPASYVFVRKQKTINREIRRGEGGDL